PDRADLQIARAGLEERLLRFDDAARDYDRVYTLLYRDPQWMLRVAQVRARQQQTAAAVAALRTAIIQPKPDGAEGCFAAAQQMARWNRLAQARDFAEQGMQKAGNRVLSNSDYQAGAATYARIMTRLRQYSAAYSRLQPALDPSPTAGAQADP